MKKIGRWMILWGCMALSSISWAEVIDLLTVHVNGDASVAPNNLRLTPALGGRAGSGFLSVPYSLKDLRYFSTYFRFVLTGGQATSGADGFAFIIQNDPRGVNALGQLGGSLGYGSTGGASGAIVNSVAVEFDTFRNGIPADPDANHIGIDVNGNMESVVTSSSIPDLNGGAVLHAWIDYDGTSKKMDVYISYSNQKPATPVLTHTIDIPAIVGEQAFFGFSGATGGLYNAHDILNWSLNVAQPDSTSVPTLSWWGILALLVGLMGIARWRLRRT